MIRDIYTRSPDDKNYVFGEYEHSNPIESIITKIKMILGTTPGEVYGDVNFGIGLEDLVFQTRVNKFEIEEKIRDQIYQYIDESADFKIRTEVTFGRDERSDFAVVDIFVNDQRSVGVLIK